jgi:hypothetical protein
MGPKWAKMGPKTFKLPDLISHLESWQARTGRGIHGLPKVSTGPAMPNPYTAVWEVARPQGGRPVAVFFPLGYPFPYGPESWYGIASFRWSSFLIL